MTVRLSAAIMAHPSREPMVADLLGRLDRPVPVVWDRVNDRHDTGIRAVQAFGPDATHHLVLQDDVLPCRDLLATVEAALAYTPADCLVSLYVGKVQPFRQQVTRTVRAAGEASWIIMDGCYWGPAIVVPTKPIPALSDWWNARGAKWPNYDRRLSKFFEAQGRRCWYTWPSLVDHQGDDSLVRRGKAIRRAHQFIGADTSGLSVDWSGPVLEMVNTARLDRRRQQLARSR